MTRPCWVRSFPARQALSALALVCVASVLLPRVYAELTPESPEVKKAVEKALKYLGSAKEQRLGGMAVMGLAAYKATSDHQHPVVQSQLDEVLQHVNGDGVLKQQDIYSLGIALIFLANIDPQSHTPQIKALIDELAARQKGHGGWGYTHLPTGDTSMTQYAVLGLWEAARAGFDTPLAAWENVANWLLRTQDPSGGFGYQGNDPGTFERTTQNEVRHSLTAGGLSSLYLCGDYLGLNLATGPTENLSAALKPVGGAKRRKTGRLSDKVDPQRIDEAQALGANWFNDHWELAPTTSQYLHYFMYSFERYESFREAFGGQPESRDWFDGIAQALLKSQSGTGSWASGSGAQVDTAFSVLFLVRSTKKTLVDAGLLGGGSMVAGRGVPKTDGALRMRGGDIVASPLNAPAAQLLSLVEDASNPESVKAAEGLYALATAADESVLNQHAVQLRKLAGADSPEARMAAVTALGRARNLDNVPTLIFALTDPDTQVVTAALESLRYISRQRPGSTGTVIADETGRKVAIEYWKNWYLAIRPDASLTDLER